MDESEMNAATAAEHEDAAAPTVRGDEEPSALLSRLRVIEDQPLETRAESLAQLHDELGALLAPGDATRSHA
jgi:hypothetical protein